MNNHILHILTQLLTNPTPPNPVTVEALTIHLTEPDTPGHTTKVWSTCMSGHIQNPETKYIIESTHPHPTNLWVTQPPHTTPQPVPDPQLPEPTIQTVTLTAGYHWPEPPAAVPENPSAKLTEPHPSRWDHLCSTNQQILIDTATTATPLAHAIAPTLKNHPTAAANILRGLLRYHNHTGLTAAIHLFHTLTNHTNTTPLLTAFPPKYLTILTAQSYPAAEIIAQQWGKHPQRLHTTSQTITTRHGWEKTPPITEIIALL